eukprot:1525597-Ditylum_brightwellii.AAC.1
MPLDGLRKFVSKHSISGCQRMNKLNLCQAIVVVAKGCNDIVVANRTAEVIDPRTRLPAHFVTLNFLNVLFGKEIWLLLANCGKMLDYTQIQDKLKTDEILWHSFSVEYNLSKKAYASDAFSFVGVNQDASIFTCFDIKHWKQASDKLKI